MSAEFDDHASSYRAEVNSAISFIGQDVDFFAERKAKLLVDIARRRLGDPADLHILDVGCGIGIIDGHLSGAFGRTAGVDVSAGQLAIAQAEHPGVAYALSRNGQIPHPAETFDVAFASCVLHHVDGPDRLALVLEMGRVVRQDGLVVIIEHNPWNPFTRLVVRRVAFDAGVRLATASGVVGLLEHAGLVSPEVVNTTFLPWRASFAYELERRLARVPFGAQYAAVARKPAR